MMSWVKGMAFILVAWSMDNKAQWSLWICECFVYQMRAAKRMQYILVWFFQWFFFLLLLPFMCIVQYFVFAGIIFAIWPKPQKTVGSKSMMFNVFHCVCGAWISFCYYYWIKCSVSVDNFRLECRDEKERVHVAVDVVLWYCWKQNNCSNILQ